MSPQNKPPPIPLVSQTSEYALRAVVHLAQAPDGSPAAAIGIAESIRVPVGYLQKILRMLARAGILDAQRGVGGGFSLAKVASAISVLDVLHATESDVSRIERCPLGIPGHTRLCSLHRLLDDQIAEIRQTFAATSIADLLAEQDASSGLCSPTGVQPLTVQGSGTGARKPSKKKPS